MKMFITPNKWNKLSPDEKVKRINKFNKHVDEYNKKGIPWGLGDLKRLATQYQIPVPTNINGMIKNKEEMEFRGFE